VAPRLLGLPLELGLLLLQRLLLRPVLRLLAARPR
jgi:hypothetical protein